MQSYKVNDCKQNVSLLGKKKYIHSFTQSCIKELEQSNKEDKEPTEMINELVKAINWELHEGHSIGNLRIEHEM